jgi:D-alanine-D-alanine ligase
MKKNLAVFFGGPSVEHEVSVISGIQAYNNADLKKYNKIAVYWARDGYFYVPKQINKDVSKIGDFKEQFKALFRDKIRVTPDLRSLKMTQTGLSISEKFITVDLILPVFHGTAGEDGSVQGLFEIMKVPYCFSDVTASAIGIDKIIFKSMMQTNDIPVLDFTTMIKNKVTKISNIKSEYPLIAKPARLGSSIGVNKVNNEKELKEALAVIFELDTKAIIEPYLQDMMEVNCAVLGSSIDPDNIKTSVCEQPLTKDEILTFQDKYLRGGKGAKGAKSTKASGMASLDRRIPADISKDLEKFIRETAKKIFEVCGCSGTIRVDFMIDKLTNKIYVTEINTIPGSLSFYLWEASGISFSELIDRLIEIAEYEFNLKNSLLRSYESSLLSD